MRTCRSWIGAVALALGLLLSLALHAQRLPFDVFARNPSITDPSLAPDGKHLVVTDYDAASQHYRLLFFELQKLTPKLVKTLPMGRDMAPAHVVWVSADHIMIQLSRRLPGEATYYPTGEIMAADLKSSEASYLFGPAGPLSPITGGDGPGPEAAWGLYNGQSSPPDNHFVISAFDYDDSDRTRLIDLNALDVRRHVDAILDGSYLTSVEDDAGHPRYAYGFGNKVRYRSLWLHGGQWQPLDPALHFRPLAISADTVYGLQTDAWGTDALVSRDTGNDSVRLLAQDPQASVDLIEWTPPPRRPFAYTLGIGRPKARYLEDRSMASRLHRQLSAKFPGDYVHFIDFSQDGGTLLWSLRSDRLPPRYYIWQRKEGASAELFSSRPWIDPSRMAERRSLMVRTRDGLSIEVILTLPPGTLPHHPLPMVLIASDGSFVHLRIGSHVSWFFDPTAQFLANRGYLVAQVNTRGSGGRGQAFQALGNGQWNGRILDDLTDASHQLIKAGYADPMRICTMGSHLGAYIAMRAAIQQPDVFRCAIGDSGIYDLSSLHRQAFFGHTPIGRASLRAVLGQDDEALHRQSPIQRAAGLSASVLLIHGTSDIWYPYVQARALQQALKDSGNPPTMVVMSDEDSSLHELEHGIRRLQVIQRFLDQNLRPQVSTLPLQQPHGPPPHHD